MTAPGSVPLPCGIAVPQVFVDEPVDMGLVREFSRRAEALGYHSLWTQEQIIGSTPVLEPISLLCHVAAVTSTIGLGTAVVIASTRNPVHLAKQLATLDQMSGGRLIAGLALGGRRRQYSLLGGPTERRVRHFTESVEVIRALWTEAKPTYDGHFWKLNGESIAPKPLQQPHPPIWMGGRHPDGLRRSARIADGWMGAGSTGTAEFRGHVAALRDHLAERGKDAFAISKRVYVALDDDEDRAGRRLAHWFGERYGNAEMAARVCVWGGEQRCVDGLAEVVDAGAKMLMLNPLFDHMEHVEALMRDIVPKLPAAPIAL